MRPPDLFELLRRCTIEHDWTAAPDGIEAMLAGADPRTVGRAAAEHGVANLLYLSARELPTLDPELRSLLATVYHLNLTHHMKVIGELTSLAATLDAAGVPFMVVKGPVLAEVIYPRNDMRSYGDLDLVIDRRVFGDAVTALLESGCDMLDRNWRVIRREMRGPGAHDGALRHLRRRALAPDQPRLGAQQLRDRHGRAVRARPARVAGRAGSC